MLKVCLWLLFSLLLRLAVARDFMLWRRKWSLDNEHHYRHSLPYFHCEFNSDVCLTSPSSDDKIITVRSPANSPQRGKYNSLVGNFPPSTSGQKFCEYIETLTSWLQTEKEHLLCGNRLKESEADLLSSVELPHWLIKFLFICSLGWLQENVQTF